MLSADSLFEQLNPDMQARVGRRLRELDEKIADGHMRPEWFQGKRIVDWEAGDCAYGIALFIHGADYVACIDTWMMMELVPEVIREHPSFYVAKQSIAEFCDGLDTETKFDLVFANTVTEHLQDLPLSFDGVRRLLRVGGLFITNHDNYYQPVGSHDHGFLYYSGSRIVPNGVDCWNREEKCEASAAHRTDVAKNFPWSWNESHEAQKNPDYCPICPYFRRSRPWAHLMYQDEFMWTWATSFTTHRDRGTINKVTPFQLRQFVIEAGFKVVYQNNFKVENEIPRELLQAHTADTLTTSMIWIVGEAW